MGQIKEGIVAMVKHLDELQIDVLEEIKCNFYHTFFLRQGPAR